MGSPGVNPHRSPEPGLATTGKLPDEGEPPVMEPDPDVDAELVGWPGDDPILNLDHERFAYAGKFVMSDTGKAVLCEERGDEEGSDDEEGGDEGSHDGEILAAASFSPDRTDETVLRIRYITVRRDRRGEGLGPRLAAFVARRAFERGYERAKIAVNNPYAYQALYRAGFGFTGEETGLAELVLVRPGDRSTDTYQAGLERFRERDLEAEERAFVEGRLDSGLPCPEDSEP